MRLGIRSQIRWLAACAAAASFGAASCGDDEVPAPGVEGPRGPISLRIASVAATGGAEVLGDTGGELALACDRLLHVSVELLEWRLRPPNACGGARQCGWLVLRIDPSDGDELHLAHSANSLITTKLPSLEPLSGEHELRVELRTATGEPFMADGGVLADTVRVTLLEPAGCEPPDAGIAADGGEGGPSDDAAPDAEDARPDGDGATSDAGDASGDGAAPEDATGDVADASSDVAAQ